MRRTDSQKITLEDLTEGAQRLSRAFASVGLTAAEVANSLIEAGKVMRRALEEAELDGP